MFICRISKQDITKSNASGKVDNVREIVSIDPRALKKDAFKYMKEVFIPSHKTSKFTSFAELDFLKELNKTIGHDHNFYNGRAMMFTDQGCPISMISIDIYTMEVVN